MPELHVTSGKLGKKEEAGGNLIGPYHLIMCGRFAMHIDHEDVFNQLIADGLIQGEEEPDWVDRGDFHPRYNIAPRSRAAVVRQRRDGENEESEEGPSREEIPPQGDGDQEMAEPKENEEPASLPRQKSSIFVHTMRWGVVPPNTKEDLPSATANTINARVETILQGWGMWSRLAESKRCVIICDGYYEWLTRGKNKLPHLVRHPDPSKKLYMAGFWDSIKFEGSPTLFTFSIVTLPAHPDMEWLHDRMPLIFSPTSPEDMDRLKLWLDPTKQFKDGIKDLLETYQHESPGPNFEIYRVPLEVGKVGNESPTFIERIDERKDGIKAMFAKAQKKATPSSGSSGELSLKRPISATPEGQTSTAPDAKKIKVESPVKAKPAPSKPPTTPKKPKAPPSSPRKKKVEASPSKSIVDFFPVSPRKREQS